MVEYMHSRTGTSWNNDLYYISGLEWSPKASKHSSFDTNFALFEHYQDHFYE